MTLYERTRDDLIRRRERVLSGKINCIPCSFPRFSQEWPGIEKGKYIIVTAQQKVGKTQLADKMFLYDPFFYAFNNPDKIRLKIFYFSLEISAEEKYKQFLCHLLYKLSHGKIRIDQRELNSVTKGKPLSQEIIDIMDSPEYQKYYDFFEECITIISDIRNPTGIMKFMKKYAEANGKWHKKTINIVDKATGEITPTVVNDYYEPNDPDEYVLVITDHIGLITPEGGEDLHKSMSRLSSKYFLELKDDYKYIPVAIQQQALAGESTENVKLNKLKPSVADLGDNKLTSRDCNIMLGIFSPFRHDIHEYMGYSIDKFRDNIRFMEIMISREGGNGMTCPLYFDGKVNFFMELPLSNNQPELERFYNLMHKNKINEAEKFKTINFLFKTKRNEQNSSISKKRFWKIIKFWFNSTIKY